MTALRWVLAGLLMLAPLAAFGAPSQLIQIPTADIVPLKQLQAGVQNGNKDLTDNPSFFLEPQPNYQFQYGLTRRIELGLDIVPARSANDFQPIFNAKYDVLQEGYDTPAVGVGLATLGPHQQATSYLVISRTLNYQEVQYQKFRAHHRNTKLRGRRLHVGVMRLNGRFVPMVGSDIELSDHFVLYADWMGGTQNGLAMGGSFVFNQRSNLTTALLYLNGTHKINGLILNYGYNFNF